MYYKWIKLKQETNENQEVFKKIMKMYSEHEKKMNRLEIEIDKWKELGEVVKKETRVNLMFFEVDGNLEITEEGYNEPTPDPMMTYMEDLGTFNNIKTTYELGLISDEEMGESSEYMKSIYPSEKSTFARRIKVEKPALFEKFRAYR